MGHKSSYSKYFKELGKNIIETATITDNSLAALMQSESDKIQELIKKNASIDDLLKSSKIFNDMLFNLVLVQLVPILKTSPKNDSSREENNTNLSEDSNIDNTKNIVPQILNFSGGSTENKSELQISAAVDKDTNDGMKK